MIGLLSLSVGGIMSYGRGRRPGMLLTPAAERGCGRVFLAPSTCSRAGKSLSRRFPNGYRETDYGSMCSDFRSESLSRISRSRVAIWPRKMTKMLS
jgi:hypothetical protein